MDIQASTRVSTGSELAGPSISDVTPRLEEHGLSREAYSMLAQANLLRMRGRWPEAIEKCMAALRLSPEHPTAQSLLGDIYDNQGRLDDAIQWYRMALDVQPDSPADRIKLARLLDLKSRDLTAPVSVKPAADPGPASSPSAFVPLPRWPQGWNANPDGVLRWVAFLTGSLAVIIVVAALVMAHRTGALPFLGPTRQVNAPAIVVPTVTPPTTALDTLPAAVPVPADPSEAALLTALQTASALAGQPVSVVSVQTDPRAGRLTVTVACRPPAGATVNRDLILRQATRVLQAAAPQGDPQATPQITIRCLLVSPSGGSTPLVFTADTSRGTVAALNPNLDLLTTDQLTAAYTTPWWGPTLAP